MKCKIMHRCRGGDGKFSTRNGFLLRILVSLFNIKWYCNFFANVKFSNCNFRILINQLSIYLVYKFFFEKYIC